MPILNYVSRLATRLLRVSIVRETILRCVAAKLGNRKAVLALLAQPQKRILYHTFTFAVN
jgi:hypothetical protein